MRTEEYSKYRENIKDGDLLIWSTETITSINDLLLLLSQKILDSKYSHVGISVWVGNRVLVYEANVPEVKLKALSQTRDFYHLPLNIEWKDKYYEFLFKELGKKYDLWDLIFILLKLKSSQDNWYCSEIAAYFYKNIGYIDSEKYGLVPSALVDELLKVSNSELVRVILDKANS